MEQRSLFGLSEDLEKLSAHGDPLEVLAATVDFEYFRGWLVEGLGYGDGSKGGRPPFDPVSMFKALILQAQHNLSDARMEFMIRDRLSWMRFLDFDLGGPTPDENIICPLSESADGNRHADARDESLRLASEEEGLHPDIGADRRREPGPGAQAAQHRWRGGGHQGGPEGHEHVLDAEGRRQAALSARWHTPADDRGTGIELQITYQHRPPPRLHPSERSDLRLGGGRTYAPAASNDRQQILGGLGGQRLSLPKEREMAGVEDADQPRPPPQTGRQAAWRGPRRN